ncbi:MAG: hypothetical protein COA45_03475 [Zetaproteobacteria bacterium]|nr:MAG: hypothetical protein COA45_03475 [Zetaproteobacteria bacterium]
MSLSVKYYTENAFVRSSGGSDDKPVEGHVFHGFFTRLGGVSVHPYQGLNCGLGSDDCVQSIHDNRQLVAEAAGLSAAENLLSLYQVHGVQVVHVDRPWGAQDRPKADGFVTDKKDIGLGILTADCTPVLFSGHKENGAPVIGAAHAGWKGALGGVLGNVVNAMEHLGASRESIRACVGPCISKSSYEVSADFITPFIEAHEESERFFFSGSKAGHAMFDLPGYCAWRLFYAGVKNISLLDKDTYSDETLFSYRRATHRNETEYGRQISVICIRK